MAAHFDYCENHRNTRAQSFRCHTQCGDKDDGSCRSEFDGPLRNGIWWYLITGALPEQSVHIFCKNETNDRVSTYFASNLVGG